jgi:hypothetical protein
MKKYKIQNRSQKNSHSCVPLKAFGAFTEHGTFGVYSPTTIKHFWHILETRRTNYEYAETILHF